MSWKTHGVTPRDNTQKLANATVTKKSNMPSNSEPLIHVCLYKRSCWVGTLGTARHKASLPPPPPIGGTARHGTKQGGTRRFQPPPLTLLHMVCNLLLWGETVVFVRFIRNPEKYPNTCKVNKWCPQICHMPSLSLVYTAVYHQHTRALWPATLVSENHTPQQR